MPVIEMRVYLSRLFGTRRVSKVKRGVYAPYNPSIYVISTNTQTNTNNSGYHVRAREGQVGKGHRFLDFEGVNK